MNKWAIRTGHAMTFTCVGKHQGESSALDEGDARRLEEAVGLAGLTGLRVSGGKRAAGNFVLRVAGPRDQLDKVPAIFEEVMKKKLESN